jgi:hypothetical protein
MRSRHHVVLRSHAVWRRSVGCRGCQVGQRPPGPNPPTVIRKVAEATERGRGGEQRITNLYMTKPEVLLVQPLARSQPVTSSLHLLRLHAAQTGTTLSNV